MGKGLHKFFKDAANELNKPLRNLVEPGLEVSNFIPETIIFQNSQDYQQT